MINIDALFKVSYGLYIVSSGNAERGNGFISNTFFQVSSSPAKFASCCSKDNLSASIIKDCGYFSVSVLKQDAGAKLIGTFGYRSGKDVDKMSDAKVKYGESGVPIVLDDAIAILECRVVETLDVGSHYMFIGELMHAEVLDDSEAPLTYMYYREVKKGLAPKNAPTYVDLSQNKSETAARWECAACGYIYDDAKEEVKFEDLPEDWLCPVCGSDKEDFYKLEN